MARLFYNKSMQTFSRSQGIAPMPTRLGLGELSIPLRNQLWSLFFEKLDESAGYASGKRRVFGEWNNIIYDFETNIKFLPVDEFDNLLANLKVRYKTLFLEKEYYDVLDFLQFCIRHPDKPYSLELEIGHILDEHCAAYIIGADQKTIAPAATEEEGRMLQEALTSIEAARLTGAKSHLDAAIQSFNRRVYAAAIRESVHAVESTARNLDQAASSTLGPALKRLSSATDINP